MGAAGLSDRPVQGEPGEAHGSYNVVRENANDVADQAKQTGVDTQTGSTGDQSPGGRLASFKEQLSALKEWVTDHNVGVRTTAAGLAIAGVVAASADSCEVAAPVSQKSCAPVAAVHMLTKDALAASWQADGCNQVQNNPGPQSTQGYVGSHTSPFYTSVARSSVGAFKLNMTVSGQKIEGSSPPYHVEDVLFHVDRTEAPHSFPKHVNVILEDKTTGQTDTVSATLNDSSSRSADYQADVLPKDHLDVRSKDVFTASLFASTIEYMGGPENDSDNTIVLNTELTDTVNNGLRVKTTKVIQGD